MVKKKISSFKDNRISRKFLNESEDILSEILPLLDETLRPIYRDNFNSIRSHFKETSKNHTYYNIRWSVGNQSFHQN